MQNKTFSNGVQLFVNTFPKSHKVYFAISTKAGSASESKEEAGLAHALEHMRFKGTPNRDCKQIWKEAAGLGLEFNAFTSYDITSYYAGCLKQKLKEVVDFYCDIYFNCTISQKEWELEKNVISQEIKMYKEDILSDFEDFLYKKLFKGTPCEHKISGEISDIKRYKAEDIIKFKNKIGTANQVFIYFSGPITMKEAEKIYKKQISKYFPDMNALPKRLDETVNKLNFKTKYINMPCPNTKTAFAYINYNFESLTTTRMDINKILNKIIITALSKKIKLDKNLVIDLSVEEHISFSGGVNSFFINFEEKNLTKILKEFKKIIDGFLKTGFSDVQFNRAKTTLKSGLIYKYDTRKDEIFTNLSNIANYNQVPTFDEKYESLNNVKKEEVEELFKEIFTGEVILLTTGIKDPKEEWIKILK